MCALCTAIQDGYRTQGKAVEQQVETGDCIQLCNLALQSYEPGLEQLKRIPVPAKLVFYSL